MFCLELTQEAIRGESLDGWLFCNFQHRDRLTDSLLDLDQSIVSSRRWLYFVPSRGEPLKIVHSIEQNILSSLPGKTERYSERTDLETILARFTGLTCAILSDPYLQVLSTVDASSAALFASCGIHTVSAATLIQRIRGVLDSKGIQSHERAAALLYRIVHDAWNFVSASFASGAPAYEVDIQEFMLNALKQAGLVSDHPPIVASGPNSGDPHYSIPVGTRGRQLTSGDVIQFDIWAKELDGIYADISWIGYCGPVVPEHIASRAATIFQARDLVKPAIERSFAAGRDITGKNLDELVRSFILERFPSDAVRHRTGHGIDSECHGSGVNLDSIEFPDERKLLEGSCFSVEPGIYFSDSGFRTEIDIYISQGLPVVSGGPIQTELLTL